MTAQLDQNDELGWVLDKLLEWSRGSGDGSPRLCPKAIARAHARLLRERRERADARNCALILAHAIDTNTPVPSIAVARALTYKDSET